MNMIWNIGLPGIGILLLLILLVAAVRVLREYTRGVVFMLGRFYKVKGPGLILVIPVIQQMVKVDLRTVVWTSPRQDVISRGNVSVNVNAAIYLASAVTKMIRFFGTRQARRTSTPIANAIRDHRNAQPDAVSRPH